jgi:hypothetical protein
LLAVGDHPGAQATEGLSTRAIGAKHLEEKGPKRQMRGKESISALKVFLGQDFRHMRWGEQVVVEHRGSSQYPVSIGLKLTD